MNKKNRRLIGILSGIAVILLIPLIAMQFTEEVKWTLSDFLVMGFLLIGTGLLCELVIRKVRKTNWRIAFCFLLLLAFLIIWAELAVGIFGTPFAGQ
jgi:dipeptide/tripeptide permease